MLPPLVDAITRYFEADAQRDHEAIVALFTEDAVVVDEGRTWRGRAAVRSWREGTASSYQYTTELAGGEHTGAGTYRVTGRLTGNFPGGTVDLTWRFTLAGEQISRLEIAP
jgi:ketosteroid isomerase-like protein